MTIQTLDNGHRNHPSQALVHSNVAIARVGGTSATKMDLEHPFVRKVEERMRGAWSAETSSSPDAWTTANPALGQCAVTACLLQDVLGGQVVWGKVTLPDGTTESHYWNRFRLHELDLTRSQFPEGTVIPESGERTCGHPTTRDYVLSHPATRARYELLKARF